MLGEEQWKWLEQQLNVPARIRFLVSSIQVIPDENGGEKWGNFPHERKRLFDLIQKSKTNGLIILSGDKHIAEFSRYEKLDYPLYEFTSSGMTHATHTIEPGINHYRITDDSFRNINFGMLRIDWEKSDPEIKFEICNGKGTVVQTHNLKLSEISHPQTAILPQ